MSSLPFYPNHIPARLHTTIGGWTWCADMALPGNGRPHDIAAVQCASKWSRSGTLVINSDRSPLPLYDRSRSSTALVVWWQAKTAGHVVEKWKYSLKLQSVGTCMKVSDLYSAIRLREESAYIEDWVYGNYVCSIAHVIVLCRSGSHFEEMSYLSKTSLRSVTSLYSYSGLPYQV